MFKPSRALQALKTIIWRHPTHHVADGRRNEAESAVKQHYEKKKLDSRNVEIAVIKSTFHGGDGVKKEHVTVEFNDKNGNHVTTHHVYGLRDA